MSWPAAWASGPCWPEAGHAAIDQARVARVAVGRAHPTVRPRRPPAFDQHIGLVDQPQRRLDAGGLLEIQRDRAAIAAGDLEALVHRHARPFGLGAVDAQHVGPGRPAASRIGRGRCSPVRQPASLPMVPSSSSRALVSWPVCRSWPQALSPWQRTAFSPWGPAQTRWGAPGRADGEVAPCQWRSALGLQLPGLGQQLVERGQRRLLVGAERLEQEALARACMGTILRCSARPAGRMRSTRLRLGLVGAALDQPSRSSRVTAS